MVILVVFMPSRRLCRIKEFNSKKWVKVRENRFCKLLYSGKHEEVQYFPQERSRGNLKSS